MTTLTTVLETIATSTQLGMIHKHLDAAEILIDDLAICTESELLSVPGIGKKLAKVLTTAIEEYNNLVSTYSVDMLDDMNQAERMELSIAMNTLTDVLRATDLYKASEKPVRTAGKTFTVEADDTIPQSVPAGTEEAMASLTKVLRACAPRTGVKTKELLLMTAEGTYYSRDHGWTTNGKLATHTTNKKALKDRMRTISQTGYHGVLEVYVCDCVDGKIVSRRKKPMMKWNSSTRLPVVGFVSTGCPELGEY